MQRVLSSKSALPWCDALILDEPAAVLTPQGEELIQIMRDLVSRAKPSLRNTHKLKVIFGGQRVHHYSSR